MWRQLSVRLEHSPPVMRLRSDSWQAMRDSLDGLRAELAEARAELAEARAQGWRRPAVTRASG